MCRISDKRAKEILEDLNKHEVIMFENTDDEAKSEYTNVELHQALEAAIKGLEREELSDDFIKTAWEIATENKILRAENEDRPKAKWIKINEWDNGYTEYSCKKCGHTKSVLDTIELPPFCESCGARMEVDNEI